MDLCLEHVVSKVIYLLLFVTEAVLRNNNLEAILPPNSLARLCNIQTGWKSMSFSKQLPCIHLFAFSWLHLRMQASGRHFSSLFYVCFQAPKWPVLSEPLVLDSCVGFAHIPAAGLCSAQTILALVKSVVSLLFRLLHSGFDFLKQKLSNLQPVIIFQYVPFSYR